MLILIYAIISICPQFSTYLMGNIQGCFMYFRQHQIVPIAFLDEGLEIFRRIFNSVHRNVFSTFGDFFATNIPANVSKQDIGMRTEHCQKQRETKIAWQPKKLSKMFLLFCFNWTLQWNIFLGKGMHKNGVTISVTRWYN